MPRYSYPILFLTSLAVLFTVTRFQSIPGYLDADYYFSGGLQLAQGKGFTEPYLWNYLEDPQGLPNPSHGYWLPLASIITALGMWITGSQTYEAGRLFFILLAALVPPLTAALSYKFFKNTALAWTSGFLAIFPVFHLPFLPVPDNYGVYMLAGGLIFLLADRPRPWFWLGLLSGLMSLARSDGLLWLALIFLFIFWRMRDEKLSLRWLIESGALAFLGFILIMGPWYARNLQVFGSIMSPAGSRAMWVTNYDETFIYPASQLTMQHWLSSGWDSILKTIGWAFKSNIGTVIAAQGHLILFPLIVIGMYLLRKDRRIQLGMLAWLIMFLVLTFIFPFAGVRGSLFHAGAALQPLILAVIPYGLERIVAWARSKNRFTDQAYVIFRIVIIQIVIFVSVWVVWFRVIQNGWEEGELSYPAVEQFIVDHGAQPGDRLIVLSAPGYYMMTGRPALAQPYGDVNTLLAVAERYDARFFAFEASGKIELLKDVYDNPQNYPQLVYLGEIDETRIFRIP
ncbi:hypothetical protein MASR2M66_21060 [Chloroflexota bacterium]